MGILIRLTLRQVLGRKSTAVLLLGSLTPVLLAVIFVLSDSQANPQRWTANVLLSGLVVRALLPLVSLFLGTSVFGNEVDDGTAVYLLTKPTPRWQIIVAKLAVSAVVTIALIVPPTVVAARIALEGGDDSAIGVGFGVAVAAGAVAYSTVFLLTSLITSRALVAGLAYVFLWEAVISGIFTGTRVLSVRHLTLGIADAIVDARPFVFDSEMGAVTSIVGIIVATIGLTWLAVRRLEAFELRETA
jgi:ABC-2 type transport system permease protein